MKNWILLVFAVTTILVARGSSAQECQRKGFLIGLGAGPGIATASASGALSANSESQPGVATSFKIGTGLSERVLLYYANRVVFANESDEGYVQGLSGVEAAIYFTPGKRSIFMTGILGFGGRRNLGQDGNGVNLGSGIGLGYDFGNHLLIEGNYVVVNEDWTPAYWTDPIDAHSGFTITVGWLGGHSFSPKPAGPHEVPESDLR
jgi:hypothetical protein